MRKDKFSNQITMPKPKKGKTENRGKIILIDIYPLGTGDFWKQFLPVMGIIITVIIILILIDETITHTKGYKK